MKKIYISTPINGRPEETKEEKIAAAKRRIAQIKQWLSKTEKYKDDQYICSFDFVPADATEAEAMGLCIKNLLECDAVFCDAIPGIGNNSAGCSLEYSAACYYGIEKIWIREPYHGIPLMAWSIN